MQTYERHAYLSQTLVNCEFQIQTFLSLIDSIVLHSLPLTKNYDIVDEVVVLK